MLLTLETKSCAGLLCPRSAMVMTVMVTTIMTILNPSSMEHYSIGHLQGQGMDAAW
ncbi:unnamed protein product [Linum tenue]|uniref:Uncharacterized protein n=1 Tax=Linum tenue TaxID=586396 RepID=A0AAV0RB26_9ROSI|nr:unnamed protein product [Linum tenue]